MSSLCHQFLSRPYPSSPHVVTLPSVLFTCSHTRLHPRPIAKAPFGYILFPPLSVSYSLVAIVLLLSLSPVINLFFSPSISFFTCVLPLTLLPRLDSWAGWCWRCFPACLAVLLLTSTICRLCTEPHKRCEYLQHAHTHADHIAKPISFTAD